MRIGSALFAIFVLSLLLAIPVPVDGQSADETVTLGQEEYYEITPQGDTEKDWEVEYKVTQISGGPFDVYIMTSSEHTKYEQGFNFNAVVTHEKVTSAKGTYKLPDDQKYYFITDNTDNGRSSDQEPTGSVRVRIENDWNEPETELGFIGYAICGLLIVGFIAVMYFKNSRSSEPDYSSSYTPSSAGQYAAQTDSQQQSYPCASCGGNLKYVEEYGRWYCYDCQKYQ